MVKNTKYNKNLLRFYEFLFIKIPKILMRKISYFLRGSKHAQIRTMKLHGRNKKKLNEHQHDSYEILNFQRLF